MSYNGEKATDATGEEVAADSVDTWVQKCQLEPGAERLCQIIVLEKVAPRDLRRDVVSLADTVTSITGLNGVGAVAVRGELSDS